MNAFEHEGESTFLEQGKHRPVSASLKARATVWGLPAPVFLQTRQRGPTEGSERPQGLQAPLPGRVSLSQRGQLVQNHFRSALDLPTLDTTGTAQALPLSLGAPRGLTKAELVKAAPKPRGALQPRVQETTRQQTTTTAPGGGALAGGALAGGARSPRTQLRLVSAGSSRKGAAPLPARGSRGAPRSPAPPSHAGPHPATLPPSPGDRLPPELLLPPRTQPFFTRVSTSAKESRMHV